MASFALVPGAWHGAWCWDLLAAELRLRGHEVSAVDLPGDDPGATLADYAAAVPPADVVVGHSLAGLTIPLVASPHRVFLCALVPHWGGPVDEVFSDGPLTPGFPGDGATTDELRRTVWVDEEFAIRSLYHDCDPSTARRAYARLRPQASGIYAGDYPLSKRPSGRATSIVATADQAVVPDWSRRVAVERLGVEPVEIAGSHSPMLSRPAELADLLDGLVR